MNVQELYQQKLTTAEEAVKIVKSGDWVDYGWCCNQPVALDKALAARKDELFDVKIHGGVTMWMPEVCKADDAGDHFTWNSWHCSGLDRKIIGKGMGYFGPMRYSELPRFYRDGNATTDVAMIQVTPMDAHGNFSFALSASHLADMLDLGDHFRAGGGEIVAVLQQRILIERGKAGRHIVYLAVLQDDVEKALLRLPAFAGGKNGVGSGSIILPLRLDLGQPQRIECGQGLTADLRTGEHTEGQRQGQRQQRDQQMLH